MNYRAIDMTQPRFISLLGSLRALGFELSVSEFVAFLNELDPERQSWIESAPTPDVLDWIAVKLRQQPR